MAQDDWWKQDQVAPAQQPNGLPQGTIMLAPPDPSYQYKGAIAAADLANKQADARKAPADIALAEARAREAEANARGAEAQGASGAAKQRADAIDAYRSAIQLRNIADDLTRQYNSAIKNGGIDRIAAGLIGAFPTDENKTFSDTGNQARALIKKALGFTGGEGNTAAESVINYGPYLPQAGDYNAQIENKIAALYRLADQSQQKSVATLGGVPDENGRITPMAPPHAPKNGSGQGGNGPDTPDQSTRYYGNGTGPTGGDGLGLSQDGTQAVADPVGQAAAARLNAMLKGGASDEQIASYAQQVGRVDPSSIAQALQFRRQNPGYTGDYNFSGFEKQSVPMGWLRSTLNDASQTSAGAYGMNAANALTFNTLDNLTPNPELARAGMDAASAAHPVASGLGTLTGGALAAGGLEAGAGGIAARYAPALAQGRWIPRLADALYGAGSGAGAADEGNRGTGALLGAVTGTAGGMFGRAATRGLANSASGIRNAAIDELRTRGIPLTVGQALAKSGRTGAAIKGIEDAMSSVPVVGDMLSARRNDSMTGAVRSAFRDSVEPIGQQYNGDLAEQGVENLKSIVSDDYGDFLDPARFRADRQFVDEIGPVIQDATQLPAPMGERARYMLNNKVGGQFTGSGDLTGRRFQQGLRAIRRARADNAREVNGDDFADIATRAEDALTGMVERQRPDLMPRLRNANEANKRVETLRDAVNRARNGSRSGEGGLPSISQISDAAAATAKHYGNRQGTTDQPFFDLTSAARDVIPSRLPDSGTWKRLLVGSTLLGAGGGTDYATGSDGKITGAGLTLGALLAAGGTKAGQRALTTALLDRPQTLRVIGDQIRRQARKGGIFGASLSQLPTQTLLTDY